MIVAICERIWSNQHLKSGTLLVEPDWHLSGVIDTRVLSHAPGLCILVELFLLLYEFCCHCLGVVNKVMLQEMTTEVKNLQN